MRIYLLRHGIAEDAGPKTPDSKRALTDEGRKKLGGVLHLAKTAKVKPDLVISSPLVRALQTAEMARDILGVESPVQQTERLIPEASPRNVWDELRGLRTLDEVLLAGHEPLLGELTAFLLGSPALQVQMKKASLVCIEMDGFRGDPHGILKWMITPGFVA